MEIGSEFQNNSSLTGKNDYLELCDYPKKYVLSGRTGLHIVANELKTQLTSILMPAYCCGSMIAPFVLEGLSIEFYDSFDIEKVYVGSVNAVLIMDYFGYISEKTLLFASKCKKAGMTVIIDATQTAFSFSKTYELADYIVVSYRKWFDCLGAIVYSKNGFLFKYEMNDYPDYGATWRKAAKLKERYISTSVGNKQEYLSIFAEANRMLDANYKNCAADNNEIDLLKYVDSNFIRFSRRKNANYLINNLKKISANFNIQLLFDNVSEFDCPLFVPILVDEGTRNLIRTKLIDNGVYCPVHWPIDKRYPYQETIYHKTELSLICDQRYGLDEMKKQVTLLTEVLCELKNRKNTRI